MLIGKFALVDVGVLQVVCKIDRSVLINTFPSSNDCVFDLIRSESSSVLYDTDFDFWHAAVGHQIKANVNRKLCEAGYLIPECPSKFTCNPCTLSKSQQIVSQLVKSKAKEVFELRHTDIYGHFPNELYVGSKYCLTVFHDFSSFFSVFFLKQKLDTLSLFVHFLTILKENLVN
jgi:hypothetical protein